MEASVLKTNRVKPSGRRYSLADRAKSLAVILQEEFGAPFVFYDTESGELVWFEDLEEAQERAAELALPAIQEIVAEGRGSVDLLAHGGYQLALPLYESDRPVLVASAVLTALASTGSATDQEALRLQKWLQAVADRLRHSEQLLGQRRREEEHHAQVKSVWEVILTLDHLMRHLRIYKSPGKNQQRILQATFELLEVQTLMWVPQSPDEPVLIQGEECLAPSDCHQLAIYLAKHPDLLESGPLVCNQVQETSWGARFPQLLNLMAFPVHDQMVIGWIIAINKREDGRNAKPFSNAGGKTSLDTNPATSAAVLPFRRSDAALLTPFVSLFELHVRSARRYQDLKDLLVGLTRSLTSALDAKDTYTYGHSERVGRIAVELAKELGLEGDEIGDIYLAGLLHDIGKIGISDAILGKRGPLTPEEFEHAKQHVTIGYSILADLRQLRNVVPGVLYHHERYDGTGYPDGLTGEAIPLIARILAVADSYDAMSTTRPYREPMPFQRVEEILVQGAGKQWDKRIIEAFMRCRHKIHVIRQRGVGESLRQAVDGVLRKEGGSSIRSLASLPFQSTV
jgi:HD-GYP domain-containing protein (c-di-GMP phosphodiesterase class II)